MNSNESQPNTPQIPPNQTAANLGFVNTMQEQLLQYRAKQQGKAPVQASTVPKTAPQQEQEPKAVKDTPKEEKTENVGEKMKEMELSITQKLDDIRKELKGDQKREVDVLKKQIEEALK